jgi:hypothetical protein
MRKWEVGMRKSEWGMRKSEIGMGKWEIGIRKWEKIAEGTGQSAQSKEDRIRKWES